MRLWSRECRLAVSRWRKADSWSPLPDLRVRGQDRDGGLGELLADHPGRDTSPSVVCVGGIRMSTITRSGRCSRTSAHSSSVRIAHRRAEHDEPDPVNRLEGSRSGRRRRSRSPESADLRYGEIMGAARCAPVTSAAETAERGDAARRPGGGQTGGSRRRRASCGCLPLIAASIDTFRPCGRTRRQRAAARTRKTMLSEVVWF